jgi:hypothetical protein
LNEGLKFLRHYIGEFLRLPGKKLAVCHQPVHQAIGIKEESNGMKSRLRYIFDPHIAKMEPGYRGIMILEQFHLFLTG